ncbi:uncharacterized protein LOC115874849, partial [Sitophilus oryzae]|uniref:Uncharacterized protein LOC115874849 n=2 Tax=Sitophilus oryzae TaxID=7048 RepID=A0A6J2X4B6_SITOR
QNHVKALFNLNQVHEESSQALRKLIDNVSKHLRDLTILDEPTNTWDTLVIYLISIKLDNETLKHWEEAKSGYVNPTLDNLTTFLKHRADMLETLEQSKNSKRVIPRSKGDNKTKAFVASKPYCVYCKKDHYIQNCEAFVRLSIEQRRTQAMKNHLCLNCLRLGHTSKMCYASSCKTCNARHNTLLHEERVSSSENEQTVNLSSHINFNGDQVLLSTALLKIFDKNGKCHVARALLDSGSQSSFITEDFCNKLQFDVIPTKITVSGLSEAQSNVSGKISIQVHSKVNNFSFKNSFLVIRNITETLPNFKINIKNLNIPDNIKLADPHFYKPERVDVLLGADCFWNLMCVGQIKLNNGLLLQKGKLGWVIAGRMQSNPCTTTIRNFSKANDIDKQLTRFCELEEFRHSKPLSNEEKLCEEEFVRTFKRDSEGRFVVTIPLKQGPEVLGDKYDIAKPRFLSLERRFKRDPEFKKRYINFINEYKNMKHMSKIEHPDNATFSYYMPHHGVIKESSLTTKLRVVFDASCPSSSGYSFNDLQLVGPTIQSDLFSLLLLSDITNYVIANVIQNHFYVDDLLSGADTIEEAINIVTEISKVLNTAGFRLRKWISNNNTILQSLKERNEADTLDLGVNELTKTLGVTWNGKEDCFLYKIGNSFNKHITKRTVLSEIAQIFDPMGLLSPCIIVAKIILRDIWIEKLDWDESLSQPLHTRWLNFRNELSNLNNIKIPRQITCKHAINIEIHGFSDASSYAYGACVYLRSQNEEGKIQTRLICAKSKIAPLKVQTIPRLELIGALLLSRLIKKILEATKLVPSRIVYWCDSTIVLGWLNMSPNQLQVFVANRVSELQTITNVSDWRHVPSSHNPADLVSRGVRPKELPFSNLYWFGPDWLKSTEDIWPHTLEINVELPELRERSKGALKHTEIANAHLYLVRFAQHESFAEEIFQLQQGEIKRGRLSHIQPFFDKDKIMRVGGRLGNTDLDFNRKFPIILSSKHIFSELLFDREHRRLLHCGPQHLLASICQSYWPLGGRNLARKIYRECVKCFRTHPKSSVPLMGNLPKNRITPAPAFYRTGVDYAGPFSVKDRQGRGCKITKAYIALFVCFVTKAIHIELVSDLTKEAFLASFKRFIARRGKPIQMFSDNGTNFVGANFEMQRLYNFLQENNKSLSEHIENEGVSWSFIPSRSPHFGGLWEAGIKSVKCHLKRVAVQIEAVLNSRPLSPLSNEPSDLTPLTPSHFLIGRPLTSLPERDLVEIPENRLSTYQRIQQLQQHFWSRWSLEYISELQQRSKWQQKVNPIKINDLVVIKEENQPPLKWSLGRVIEVYPGKDGTVRVATVKTSTESSTDEENLQENVHKGRKRSRNPEKWKQIKAKKQWENLQIIIQVQETNSRKNNEITLS